MTFQNLIEVLNTPELKWLRVNDELCVHSYTGSFYILLCKWKDHNGTLKMHVEVDDIVEGKNDVFAEEFHSNSDEYQKLMPIYDRAKKIAVPAQRTKVS